MLKRKIQTQAESSLKISEIKLRIFKSCYVFFIFSILLLILSSCEKKINWEVKSGEDTYLVVDGIITNELKQQSILLTLSNSELNQTVNYADNATVSVFDGELEYLFIQSDSLEGLYISASEFSGVINKTYTLHIEYRGNTYSASANMIPVSTSSPLTYVQVPDTNMYYIASDLAVFNPNEPFMAEVLLDWSTVSGYENFPPDSCSAHMYFYHLTTIDVNQIFSPESETVLFPEGSSIIQKKYSLTPEHERFIRSLLAETIWHGGNFDLEEGNVYTNMSEGALGFFAACSVIADTSVVH